MFGNLWLYGLLIVEVEINDVFRRILLGASMAYCLDAGSTNAHPSLVVVIYVEADGTRFVRSVEIMSQNYVTRFFFSQNNTLSEVLTDEAVDAFDALVDRANTGRALISLPDEKVRLTNLSLKGCDIFVGSSKMGGERLMLRFQKAFGNVLALLRKNITVIGSAVDEPGALAVETLETAMLPLFNLAHHIETVLDSDDTSDPARLRVALELLVDRIRETEQGFGIHKPRFLPEQPQGGPSAAMMEMARLSVR